MIISGKNEIFYFVKFRPNDVMHTFSTRNLKFKFQSADSSLAPFFFPKIKAPFNCTNMVRQKYIGGMKLHQIVLWFITCLIN